MCSLAQFGVSVGNVANIVVLFPGFVQVNCGMNLLVFPIDCLLPL